MSQECANRARTLRGIMANHSGLCLTVFSASNYCGSVGAMVARCRCNWTKFLVHCAFFFLNLRQSRRCSRAATVNEKAPCQQWFDRRKGISQLSNSPNFCPLITITTEYNGYYRWPDFDGNHWTYWTWLQDKVSRGDQSLSITTVIFTNHINHH